jgi:asparagine synthase (glutamine-hydrolysing)
MMDSEERTVIAANGEIYNFQGLRKALLGNGHKFKSKSDSEVLLHGYEEWGVEGLLERIEGMFAFAIYDQESRKIFLVRDRVGIKPMYFSLIDSRLAWASELKALAVFHGERLETDPTALYDFMTYLYIPTPKTCYKNVYKLEPAHYAEFDVDNCSFVSRRYWQLEVDETPITIDEASERLRELIDKTVKEQLISDVPIGFFLSGGLDSSAVVAAATNATDLIDTYSIGFDDKRHDETHYAHLVARHFETRHKKKILTYQNASRLIERMKIWYSEPHCDTSAIPTYLVSEFARKGLTVVLTGDGGDEIFGGYRWYNRFDSGERDKSADISGLRRAAFCLRRKYGRSLLGRIANRVIKGLSDEIELHLFILGGMLMEEKKAFRQIWQIDDDYDDYWYLRKYWRPELPLKTRLQYADFHTLLHDDMLTKVDRTSMAVGLEARVPLLATELVSFAFSLPESLRYHNDVLKGLLKYSFRNILPKDIIGRRKKGFSIPIWGDKLLLGAKSKQERMLDLFGFSPDSL